MDKKTFEKVLYVRTLSWKSLASANPFQSADSQSAIWWGCYCWAAPPDSSFGPLMFAERELAFPPVGEDSEAAGRLHDVKFPRWAGESVSGPSTSMTRPARMNLILNYTFKIKFFPIRPFNKTIPTRKLCCMVLEVNQPKQRFLRQPMSN